MQSWCGCLCNEPRQRKLPRDTKSAEYLENNSIISGESDNEQSVSANDAIGNDDFTLAKPPAATADRGQCVNDEAEGKPRGSTAIVLCVEQKVHVSAETASRNTLICPAEHDEHHKVTVTPHNAIIPLHRGPSVSANEVLEVVRKSWESNIFQTQDYLYDMLFNHADEDFVSRIRKSEEYENMLRTLRVYDCASNIFGKLTDYKQAGTVDIDYLSLGVEQENMIGCNPEIPLWWKKSESDLSLRLFCEFPIKHQSGRPFSVGYASMWDELDLWHQWHPIVPDKGPDILIGGEQEERSEFGESAQRLVDQRVVILAMLKWAELARNYKFFPPNTGAFVEVTSVLTDTDIDNNRFYLKKYTQKRGYTRKTDAMDITSVCIMQKDTCFVGVGVEMFVPRFAPSFFVGWILKTLVPGIVSNMFRSGAKTLEPGSPYFPRLQADKKGLYRHVSNMMNDAAARENERGCRYSSDHMPPSDFLNIFGDRSLLRLETELEEKFGPRP